MLFGPDFVTPCSQGVDVTGDGWDGDAEMVGQHGSRVTSRADQAEHRGKPLFDLKGPLVKHHGFSKCDDYSLSDRDRVVKQRVRRKFLR